MLFIGVLSVLQIALSVDDSIFFEHHTQRRSIAEDKCYENESKCVEIINCPSAIQQIKSKRFHSYKRCGFNDKIEIICCPLSDIKSTTTEKGIWSENDHHSRLNDRKAVQVCEEYTNEIKPNTVAFLILDGEDASIGEFPHMVALGYGTDTIGEIKWSCGGTLISDRFVLTAAHCIINSDSNPPVSSKMGMVDLNATNKEDMVQQIKIENITVYPGYNWREKTNDIALIKLESRVRFSEYVHPACLYDKSDDPSGLLVTGWGDTEVAGSGSQILQKAALMAVDLKECNETYTSRTNKHVLESQICASHNTSDTCQGDSGGPLQIQNKPNSSVYSIVGVTSYGIGCGSKYPGIYTRVSNYLDWIEKVVWGE